MHRAWKSKVLPVVPVLPMAWIALPGPGTYEIFVHLGPPDCRHDVLVLQSGDCDLPFLGYGIDYWRVPTDKCQARH